jgi:long-chain acyl-CoA synthetase
MVARNLKERFEKSVLEYSDKIAIKYKKGDKWTGIAYGDLGKNIKSLSAFLLNEGIKKDVKIAILMENRPEWPTSFFATVSIGAVSVPLNTRSTREEIVNILKASGCEFIFVDKNTSALVKDIEKECPSVKKVISVDSDAFKRAIAIAERVGDVKISSDDIACILYTSGTTAEPKGVMLSHGNLLSNCDSQHKINLIMQKDSVISVLPLHHTYPLTVTMIFPLLYGCKIIYPESMRPEALLEAMRDAKATVFVAVPQIFTSFHQKIAENLKKIPFPFNLLFKFIVNSLCKIREKTGINLPRYFLYFVHGKFGRSMRLFTSGGARLDENVNKGLFKFGFTILEGYGLTETSPVLTFNPLKKPKVGSVGVPVPDVEIKIASKNEEGIGEVIAKGPNVMKGYYKRKDLTDEVIKDGWFHTGDLGYIDEEGYLFLTGRLKEVIVLSSGVNVYPEEVEEAYLKGAPVKAMCVFEVPFKKGEKEEVLALWAIVVPDLEFFKKYGEVNLKDVIRERFDNVSRMLPSHMRLMGFSITLEELPHTLLGKIKRFAVKEIYAAGAAEEERLVGEKEISREDLEMMEKSPGRRIIDYLKRQTGIIKAITPADLLELDLGIDSLGRIELASGLEKLLGVKIEDEIIGRAFTVRDLIAGLEPILPEGAVYAGREEEITFGPEYWKEVLQGRPGEENLAKIDLKPGFGAWLACFLFTCMLKVFFKMFCSLKVEGKENFPKKGSYILYANHTSYFDGLLVAAALPRFPRLDLFFIGFRPYFNVPIMRNLVKVGRIIPLDFSSHLLEAMKSCFYVMKNGKNLGLFPEGIRTLDGNIGKFKKGFGILAKESGAVLVPIILEGAFEAWPRTAKFPKRHPIKVRFGKPVSEKDAEELGQRLGAEDDYEAICLGARETLIKLKEKKT